MPRPLRNPLVGDTATRILDAAERLTQCRGFNGFSYADIAKELGVTKASLHYHFDSKTALGVAILDRYQSRFDAAVAQFDEKSTDTRAVLRRCMSVYASVLASERMCLGGMLAAEYNSVPAPMRLAIRRYFDSSDRWFARVLTIGRNRGELDFTGSALTQARALTAALEGAVLLARPYADLKRFQATATLLLDRLERRPAKRSAAA